MQPRFSPDQYRRVVWEYHALPAVTAVALVGIFLASFFLDGSLAFSTLIAAMASVFLMWRWILAGRQIDRWGCPACGSPFPKKIYWTYPPDTCPRCLDSHFER